MRPNLPPEARPNMISWSSNSGINTQQHCYFSRLWIIVFNYLSLFFKAYRSSYQDPRILLLMSNSTIIRTCLILLFALQLLACKEPAPIIKVSTESVDVNYLQNPVSIQFSIENADGKEITASALHSWVHDLDIKQDVLSFIVDENNSGGERSTTVTLEYPGAVPVSVRINQSWSAAKIVLTPASASWEYTGGSGSFTFEIICPREGAAVSVNCENKWIDIVSRDDNRVDYAVAENNSGSDRTGKIVLNYGSFATVEFLVSQKWSAPEIALSPASASWEYIGGNGSFSFDIVNPLSDADISVHSNCNWIAEVVSSNHGVSYTVLENNSGNVRDGKIVLNYGSYTVKEFFIHQSWAQSVIKLNPTYAEVGYGGELIEFSYVIENPRNRATLQGNSDSDWIKELSILDSRIRFQVQGNNSGKSRTGHLYIDYGSYAHSAFDIIQNGHPSSVMSLNLSSLEIILNSHYQLIATVIPEDSELEWTSSAPQVASVQQNGLVSALSKGEATITVKSKAGGVFASCKVVVSPPTGGTEDMGEEIWK